MTKKDEERKYREMETEETAKREIFGMNAGAGLMLGAFLGSPLTGLLAGACTGSLMNKAGKKTDRR